MTVFFYSTNSTSLENDNLVKRLFADAGSRGFFLIQAEFDDHLLAHGKFLDLTSYRHRKHVDKLDVSGNFIMFNLPTTKGQDLVRSGRDALTEPDPETFRRREEMSKNAEGIWRPKAFRVGTGLQFG